MILGIDIGVTGAIAILLPDGELLEVFDMPTVDAGKKARRCRVIDARALHRIISGSLFNTVGSTAYVEDVSAMPKQGVSSVFSLGESRGCVRAALASVEVPTIFVKPQLWKKYYGLLGRDKDASRTRAIELYPSYDCLSRKKDNGRAEAILIGRWGVKQEIHGGKDK